MKKMIFLLSVFVGVPAVAQTSVMSYNIKYANENDGENSWSKRKDHLGNQIKFYEPNIFGVQEALLPQLNFLRTELKHYDFVGTGRDGDSEGEYTAIFFDTKLFELEEHNTFWLSETPHIVSKGWDAAYRRVCTYALLKQKTTGKSFWVFNTHFDHVGDVARSKSAELIVEKVNKINSKNLPVILMGDLNLEPDTEPISYISRHFSDSRESAREVVFGPEGTFNAYEFHEPVTRRIDYIFTSPQQVQVLKYGVLSDSKNLRYPSDHFPVLVQIRFPNE